MLQVRQVVWLEQVRHTEAHGWQVAISENHFEGQLDRQSPLCKSPERQEVQNVALIQSRQGLTQAAHLKTAESG